MRARSDGRADRGLTPSELDHLASIATDAAAAAAAVIRPYFRAPHLTADRKGDLSPVTQADRAAEQAMRAILAASCPDHGILGEEFGLDRPEARLRWVLDPIDGTRAFITGRPLFGTRVGLLDGDTPLFGVSDQPITQERWVGVAGQPTRFTGPFGGNAGTRRGLSLAEAELSCTTPDMLGPHRPAWDRLAARVGRVSWGGDCYAYGLLALGQIDLIAEADLKPWDWAALAPVIVGAGGSITDWSGQALRRDGDGRVLASGDPALHAQALELLGE